MSYTILDAITQAREIVQDAVSPYRHSEPKLMGYFNDAVADARRLRPDLFIGTLEDTWVLYTEANHPDPFPLDVTYLSAVVDYISGMVGLGDDEFAESGRAQALHNRYVTKLVGKFA